MPRSSESVAALASALAKAQADLVNPEKSGMFSTAERLDLLRATSAGWANVDVDSFTGLLVDYCGRRRKRGWREPAGERAKFIGVRFAAGNKL